MSNPRFDQTACDQLADAVREIEKQTDAEIVIVVRARSGVYRQADYLAGAAELEKGIPEGMRQLVEEIIKAAQAK